MYATTASAVRVPTPAVAGTPQSITIGGLNRTVDLYFAIRVAEEAKLPVHIFHLKIRGRDNWGTVGKYVAKIEAARISKSGASLIRVLAQAEHDPAVRAIVITGAGRAFCAGADAKALEGHAAKGHYDPGTPTELAKPGFGIRPEFDADFAHHFGLSKPVVAAINGHAIAGGCDIGANNMA
jgi:hypothetical protein